MLAAIALERAGDPGTVVLRRLSNAEYPYTIGDLTGVESLDPVKPDGIRFSPKATHLDWSDIIQAEIRGFYRAGTMPEVLTSFI